MRHFVPWAYISFFASACGPADGQDANSDTASTQQEFEDVCVERCDLEVAARCENTPENYATGCAKLCSSKYTAFPECAATLRALDTCRLEGDFACDASGLPVIGPIGLCGDEGQACMDCTGSLLNCL